MCSVAGGSVCEGTRTSGPTRTETIAWKRFFLAAIADAFPQLRLGKIGKNGQFSEALAGDVNELGHPLGYHGITPMYIT